MWNMRYICRYLYGDYDFYLLFLKLHHAQYYSMYNCSCALVVVALAVHQPIPAMVYNLGALGTLGI